MGTLVETPRGWQCLTPSLRVRLFRLACRASRCCRAIDDVLFLDLSIQERDFVVRRMYPPELELKEVCRSPQPIFYLTWRFAWIVVGSIPPCMTSGMSWRGKALWGRC